MEVAKELDRVEKRMQDMDDYDVYKDTLVNLVYTHTWMNTNLKLHFDPHNITVQQYNILRILRAQQDKPATINLLRERMLDKMSDASRIVERLVQKGLVIRKVCEFDRRAVDISISEAGLNLLLVADKDIVAREIIGDSLTQEELVQLNKLLTKLRKE